MKRLLSGITPSSNQGLHLGNYLGAVKPHIEFQEKGECFYFVADLHSLNTVFKPEDVTKNTENIFIEYLAFGINPDKTTFYVQSDIPQITYLQTILNNTVTVSELSRMHAYKDKLQNHEAGNNISFGLFSYPVLMASDILIFKPDIVPVGEDQSQHVEIAREIGKTFNNRYGTILKIPDLYVNKEVARVLGTDGKRKMSKSLGNVISIFSPEDEIKKQIMNIITDPSRIHPTDPGNPEKNPCFLYLKLIEHDLLKSDSDPTTLEMEQQYKQGKIGDVTIKRYLFNSFMQYFKDVRDKKKELAKNKDFINEIRVKGQKKATELAEKTLTEVKNAVGLWK
jgi:tryptophanyl-tRNA synthetase